MAAQPARGSTTAAARLAMTASWAENHPAFRSTAVVAVRTRPTSAINHTAPEDTQRPAAAKTASTPNPAALPATPDTVLHTAPTTGTDPGQRESALCTVSAPP